jgi:ribonuclease HII
MDSSNNYILQIDKKLIEITGEKTSKTKNKRNYRNPRNKTDPLKSCYHNDKLLLEAGIDEAGRGPLFGRVYTAVVILPSEDFDHSKIKDSKRFSSKKKLMEVYNYIKENCVSYSVTYMDETVIDRENIRQATIQSMHNSIQNLSIKPDILLVDGCDFKSYTDNETNKPIDHICIEGGDNWYTSIAAASILAKVERDIYIEELCEQYPELREKYELHKNKGYGTKKHIEGIKQYGISPWHRKTFGICRQYT